MNEQAYANAFNEMNQKHAQELLNKHVINEQLQNKINELEEKIKELEKGE